MKAMKARWKGTVLWCALSALALSGLGAAAGTAAAGKKQKADKIPITTSSAEAKKAFSRGSSLQAERERSKGSSGCRPRARRWAIVLRMQPSSLAA